MMVQIFLFLGFSPMKMNFAWILELPKMIFVSLCQSICCVSLVTTLYDLFGFVFIVIAVSFKWSNKIMKIQIADPNFVWDWSVVVVGIDVSVSLSFGCLFDPFCLYFPCWYSNLFYIKLMVIMSTTTTMACSSNMHIGLIKMIYCFIVWNTILIFMCAKKEMQEKFMHAHSPNLFVCEHLHGVYQLIS